MRLSKKIKNPRYTVYTDGGCARNPGGPGGIGVVVINNETGEIQEISKGYHATTNNRMEILAVIEGLERTEEGSTIALYSDSQYTLNCMSGIWEKKKNLDLWEILAPLQKKRDIELNWVKGHNNNQYNEVCDRLATQAMQSDEKLIDSGYMKPEFGEYQEDADIQLPTQNVGGSMAVVIEIPAELQDTEPQKMSRREYVEHYKVKPACADAICDFYAAGDKSFKAYMQLKTGGFDSHSRRKLESVAEASPAPDLYAATIRKYIRDEKDANTAARWNERGLSLYDSIRKTLVDREVRFNTIGRR